MAYAGRDPRVPGFAEQVFTKPFKAMFIGAHPDDAECSFGYMTAQLIKAGAEVTFVSVCNGDNGHQTMKPEDLAARRYLETQESAKVYGLKEYLVLGEHDCIVEPTIELRRKITRLIREKAPHLVVTHRTCDYHADHRATGQAVQDSTYLIGVPLFCPETPVPETLPFVMYADDPFTVPRKLRPDLICDGSDVVDTVFRALCCHESQLFEWLPPEQGDDPSTIPVGKEARFEWAKAHALPDMTRGRDCHPETVDRFCGKNVKYVNIFELCEYSRQPCESEKRFLASVPGVKWVE